MEEGRDNQSLVTLYNYKATDSKKTKGETMEYCEKCGNEVKRHILNGYGDCLNCNRRVKLRVESSPNQNSSQTERDSEWLEDKYRLVDQDLNYDSWEEALDEIDNDDLPEFICVDNDIYKLEEEPTVTIQKLIDVDPGEVSRVLSELNSGQISKEKAKNELVNLF